MDESLLVALSDDLRRANFRVQAVESLIGADAFAAVSRGIRAAARRRLSQAEPSPLSGLIRLFILGDELPTGDIDTALPRLTAAGAGALGILGAASSAGLHRAELSLNPVTLRGDWWILSDLDDHLRMGPARHDHVMGVGMATRSLIAQAPLHLGGSSRGQSALDLGTGSGMVALALARAGFSRVLATDLSPRAVRLAQANAVLNGLEDRIEFRIGNLFDPLADEQVDLLLSNPPFVITPREQPGIPVYTYRDGGMTGDELTELVVTQGAHHLTEHGTLLCLANWESHWGTPGVDRVAGWVSNIHLPQGGIAARVIERDQVSIEQYAETWVRDGGTRSNTAEFDVLLDAWIADFSMRRVVAIGMGSIRLQRVSAEHALVRRDPAAGTFAQEPAAGLDEAFTVGVAVSGYDDAEILETRWLTHPAVSEIREYSPGSEGPRGISLVTDHPFQQRVQADPLLAAALGACDGDLTLGQIADALATLLELPTADARAALIESVRELSWLGMVAPASR